MDKGQQKRYSKDELELIKKVVDSREDAVFILRNHFLQLGVTEEEKKFLNNLPKDFFPVLAKTVLPDLTRDVPMGQQATMFSRIQGLEQMNPTMGLFLIQANDIIVDYCKQQFELLTSDEEPTIILQNLKEKLGVDQGEVRVANMVAYNQIISLLDARINNLNYLIVDVGKSEEELKKQQAMNSTK